MLPLFSSNAFPFVIFSMTTFYNDDICLGIKGNFIEGMDKLFKERKLAEGIRKRMLNQRAFSVGKVVHRLRDRVVNCYAFIRFWRALPSMM